MPKPEVNASELHMIDWHLAVVITSRWLTRFGEHLKEVSGHHADVGVLRKVIWGSIWECYGFKLCITGLVIAVLVNEWVDCVLICSLTPEDRRTGMGNYALLEFLIYSIYPPSLGLAGPVGGRMNFHIPATVVHLDLNHVPHSSCYL